jgi:hypothetical protein
MDTLLPVAVLSAAGGKYSVSLYENRDITRHDRFSFAALFHGKFTQNMFTLQEIYFNCYINYY